MDRETQRSQVRVSGPTAIVGGWSECTALSSPAIPRLRWDPWARHRTPNCSSGTAATAPGVCSQCVCVCVCLFTTHCCVCALDPVVLLLENNGIHGIHGFDWFVIFCLFKKKMMILPGVLQVILAILIKAYLIKYPIWKLFGCVPITDLFINHKLYFGQYMRSLGIKPTTFALLTQCSTTEPQKHSAFTYSTLVCF